MAVYDKNGNILSAVYNASGDALSVAYNASGIIIYQSGTAWIDEVTVTKNRDTATNTNYYVVRIPQTRSNGDKQYPFLYAPNGIGQAVESALQMNTRDGFYLAINAGIGGTYTIEQGVLPIGCLIENGTLLQQGSAPNWYILTVDENGYMEAAQPDTNGNTLISDGVISGVVGFVPIVVDGEAVDPSVYAPMPHDDQVAQRQIIGQFDNGDYCIVSCEGRNFDNSTGWTIPQAINVMLSLGVRFAYNLDGGGSVETVIGNEQLNTIYEGTYGRKVQNYIVFNGTDTFFVPND